MSRTTQLLDTYRKWRAQKLHPGEHCPLSGVYVQVADNGEHGRQATCVRGEPMPPTSFGFFRWQILDATNVDEADA